MASAYRKAGVRLLTGVEELDKKLLALKTGAANKIVRPALTKAARMLLKKMKQATPSPYKDAKRALGMVVDTKGGKNRDQQRAKVGAAVGKASKHKSKDRGDRPGVGIDAKNIHWFILGTGMRKTGSVTRKTKSGTYKKKTGNRPHSTGQMKPIMAGLVKDTANAAKSEMLQTIRTEVMQKLKALAMQG